MYIKNTIDEKITNQNFELYKEGDQYFLRMDFEYENDHGFYRGHVDKIKFDLHLNCVEYTDFGKNKSAIAKIYIPSGGYINPINFDIFPDSNGHFLTVNCIKEKVQEMTVEEIEKKLGHKIKIVSKSK